MQGQLPRYTVATACYGKEPKSTSAMYFAEKLHINLLFPDAPTLHKHAGATFDTDPGTKYARHSIDQALLM